MANVYPTRDVAATLGVAEATIRTWKSRKSEALTEGTHYVMDGKTTLWTDEGLSALRSIANGNAPATEPTTDQVLDAATEIAQPHAMEVAGRIVQAAVMQQAFSILRNPTPDQKAYLDGIAMESGTQLAGAIFGLDMFRFIREESQWRLDAHRAETAA